MKLKSHPAAGADGVRVGSGGSLLTLAGLPSISRLRREPRADDVDPATAVLEVPEEGGAIRTLVGGAHRHLIGVYFSRKSGLLNPYEGRVERALIHWSEADADTDHYQSQAARLVFATPHGPREWIIDLLRQRRGGLVEAIEVKRSPRDLRDPDYVVKLAYAAAIVRSFGWRFRIMYAKDVFGPPARRRNVERVQARRSLNVDAEMPRFERLASSTDRTTFGVLRRELSSDPVRGTAAIHHLVARGRVAVDLDRDLTDDAVVELRRARLVRSRIRF